MAKTMFGKPKFAYLSNIISLRNPLAAKGSVKELRREFDQAKTRPKRLRIARATQLASNRAGAMLERRDLSSREQREYQEVRDIYNIAAKRMFNRLRR